MAKDAPDSDAARDLPVLHGYFREHLLMTAAEKAEIRAGFAAFAKKNDYRLGKIFMERVETAPDALSALVTAALDDKAAAIAVPSLAHFSVFGHPIAIQKQLEAALHTPVLCTRTTT
ncbi:hypothetical protein AB0H36_09645 [Kribbella sp. NPDC050820]|uniref:hypothetical protein n=1 Tax=Kribbella sp. NPDC050820 TaxID=3155408 RepID=UPI003411048C